MCLFPKSTVCPKVLYVPNIAFGLVCMSFPKTAPFASTVFPKRERDSDLPQAAQPGLVNIDKRLQRCPRSVLIEQQFVAANVGMPESTQTRCEEVSRSALAEQVCLPAGPVCDRIFDTFGW